jgi:hypothetical protein
MSMSVAIVPTARPGKTGAREVCRVARDVLGGNGITLDFHVIRHICDMESRTKERPTSSP